MALTFKVHVDEELFKLTTHSIALTSERHLRIMSMAATVRDALSLFIQMPPKAAFMEAFVFNSRKTGISLSIYAEGDFRKEFLARENQLKIQFGVRATRQGFFEILIRHYVLGHSALTKNLLT